jgi:lipopolysaccharide transport system permease protein
MAGTAFELVIKPRRGWQPIDVREVWQARELFGFLIWRDIKIRYKQTLLGGLWAVLQPLIGMLIFGGLLNRVAQFPSDGSPYMLFVYSGLVPWTFFMNSVSLSSNSLVANSVMMSKIYFPRMLLPMGAIGALALDMVISLGFMGILIVYYRWPVGVGLLALPIFMVGSFLAAAGLGMILATLNVRYRDVKYAVPFAMQMMFFLTPVLYPLSLIPEQFRPFLALNPMAGMIEGFRYALLGSDVPFSLMAGSFAGSLALFIASLYFFRRMERTFADVI